MNEMRCEVFPIDSWGQRIVMILNLLFFSFLAATGLFKLVRPTNNQSQLESLLGQLFAVGAILTGLILTLLALFTLNARWNARIEIEEEVFRFYKSQSDLDYERDLEHVFSLQSAQIGLAFKPNVFFIHFSDGRRFTFSSRMARSQELRALLEERTQKTFSPGAVGPTKEETLPFSMPAKEVKKVADAYEAYLERWAESRGIPKSLEEARARFGDSLVGFWGESNMTGPPIESSLTVLPDGYAIISWTRILGGTTDELYEWRQLGPFCIETREIDAKGNPGEWHASEYRIEEFRMFETSRAEYQLRGIFGGLKFSRTIASDLTLEKYKQEYGLNLEDYDEA